MYYNTDSISTYHMDYLLIYILVVMLQFIQFKAFLYNVLINKMNYQLKFT